MKNWKKKMIPAAVGFAALCLFPVTGAAAEQQNLATATSRTYDGTAVVEVTDMYFELAVSVDYEDMSATATGTLASPNAGHYDMLEEMTNIVFKDRGPDTGVNWSDWYVTPERMTNIPTDVTIYKADPVMQMSASSDEGQGGQEITVTAVIENDFGYQEGLPTAEQVLFTAVNAEMKEGTSVVQNGNQYSAVFVLTQDKQAQEAVFSVNVSEDAVNYNALEEALAQKVSIWNPADYSAVDAAIEKAEALNRDEYKDFSAVDEAIAQVVRGKGVTEQDEVDAMAEAIENAIAGLEKKAVQTPEATGTATPTPTPTASSKPEKQEKPESTAAVDSVSTGDANLMEAWTVLAVIAAAALAVTAGRIKKAERK